MPKKTNTVSEAGNHWPAYQGIPFKSHIARGWGVMIAQLSQRMTSYSFLILQHGGGGGRKGSGPSPCPH